MATSCSCQTSPTVWISDQQQFKCLGRSVSSPKDTACQVPFEGTNHLTPFNESALWWCWVGGGPTGAHSVPLPNNVPSQHRVLRLCCILLQSPTEGKPSAISALAESWCLKMSFLRNVRALSLFYAFNHRTLEHKQQPCMFLQLASKQCAISML